MLDTEFAQARTEIFARAATDGAHPRLASVLAQPLAANTESADDQLARVLGLMLDGLLPLPRPT